MSDSDPPLVVEHRPGYRMLLLNRPARLNAFDAGLHAALRAALEEAAADPACRALLLAGSGRAFCAGQDLAEPGLTGPEADLEAVLDRGWNPLVRAIRALPKPVVCAVQGTAAGAGASLAFACDITLAAEDARFAQAFIRIGLVPDSGATWTLPRLAGPQRARALAMLGDPITGTEAAQYGLVWRAVPAAALLEEAHALCARLARLPAEALSAIKQALDAAEGNSLDAQLALEARLQRGLGRSADFAEGVAAFQQKRPARFEGAPE
ncbi:enoyl-CoA hydratase-related protein [Paracraurococcus ruber]|uniref:2-(1,2-epoxy-1,2-dihydrophenyl)acetyl-CoA isomerase n=1 Tax=Paracraurococcus ruber TaxID=77675 RepID=A0ABS1CXZ5_9PROT|nr:enoyl-CoA hydratase-related protein [Paracraurococcus ruber]MBK1659195.1 2-(1,2-epoxy-1,2-dihydrophenyl)acetyl-CoA isomerase [Paracraurococcus ruber]TDG32837.1 2-(1,2-epoxy-1,2-dihydrophenyl)acetyl-CoA isomerase [Paracraurococcus ruber]